MRICFFCGASLDEGEVNLVMGDEKESIEDMIAEMKLACRVCMMEKICPGEPEE